MSTEEIENYFVESAGYGRDKVRNFMDIVNKALKQKGERIADLEKENAELKAQLESERDLPAIAYMQGAEKQKKKDEEHLTKAKEHIRTLISCLIDWVKEGDKYYCHIADAEQFLKG